MRFSLGQCDFSPLFALDVKPSASDNTSAEVFQSEGIFSSRPCAPSSPSEKSELVRSSKYSTGLIYNGIGLLIEAR